MNRHKASDLGHAFDFVVVVDVDGCAINPAMSVAIMIGQMFSFHGSSSVLG